MGITAAYLTDVFVIIGLVLLAWLLALWGRRKPVLAEERSQRGPVVVLVHGWRRGNSFWTPFLALATTDEAFSDTTFHVFPYRAGFFNRQSLDGLGATLRSDLVRFAEREIHLVGFGIGALIVRAAYLEALRDYEAKRPSPTITRLVLIAPPNQGLGAHTKPWMLYLRRAIGGRLISDAYVGSKFLLDLRLGWIKMKRAGLLTADIYQIRGSSDRYVTEEDAWDINCPPGQALVVPGGHHEMARPRDREDTIYVVLRDFLRGRKPGTRKGVKEEKPPAKVDAVLFLVPGIRDWGFRWRTTISKIVKDKYPRVKVVPAQYGWFSTWDFLSSREVRVHQWAETYSREFAIHERDVPMLVLAHSYGTYAVAHALKEHADIQLDRIYFAASVLPLNFEWDELEARDQVKTLLNICGSRDLWVGLMSCGLSRFFSDLGGAGFFGFDKYPNDSDHHVVKGGHGAFSEHLDEMLRILINREKRASESKERSAFVEAIGTRSRLVLPVLVAIVLAALTALSWKLQVMYVPEDLYGGIVYARAAISGVTALLAAYFLLENV